MMDLRPFLVTKAPPTVYYVPEFITRKEEIQIIDNVNLAPKPKWTQLAHRRLQNWGGIPHPKGMIAEKLPEWLLTYTTKIMDTGIFEGRLTPNHVLVNEYLPGQGIMPHTDGPLFYPAVTTISCGSHTVLDFTLPHKDEEIENSERSNNPRKKALSLLLEQRSLLILQDEMYHEYLHAIAEVKEDTLKDSIANLDLCKEHYFPGQVLQRNTRISLTVRHVPRTSKLQLCLGRRIK